VATIDYTPYLCIPAAIEFRNKICGGEEAIRKYCYDLARAGGKRVVDILGTEVIDNKSGTLSQCYFANVKLPLVFTKPDGNHSYPHPSQKPLDSEDVGKVQRWLNATAVKEFDTYLQIAFHSGYMWVRLSGQIYLELKDFEWVGEKLKELCKRAQKGEFRC
jgi:hypothetical protein